MWTVQQLEVLACLVGVAVKPVSCDGTLSNTSFPFRLLISSLEDSPEFHLVLLMLQSIPLQPLLCLVKPPSTWLSMTCWNDALGSFQLPPNGALTVFAATRVPFVGSSFRSTPMRSERNMRPSQAPGSAGKPHTDYLCGGFLYVMLATRILVAVLF